MMRLVLQCEVCGVERGGGRALVMLERLQGTICTGGLSSTNSGLLALLAKPRNRNWTKKWREASGRETNRPWNEKEIFWNDGLGLSFTWHWHSFQNCRQQTWQHAFWTVEWRRNLTDLTCFLMRRESSRTPSWDHLSRSRWRECCRRGAASCGGSPGSGRPGWPGGSEEEEAGCPGAGRLTEAWRAGWGPGACWEDQGTRRGWMGNVLLGDWD